MRRLKKFVLLIFTFFIKFLVTEAVLNINDELYNGVEADRYNFRNHPCRRDCTRETEGRTCYYVFVVEMLSSMSKACYDCPFNRAHCFRPHCMFADGVQKTLYVVNRQMPGPMIQACRYDKIIVDVRNNMQSESTTIHWHGFKQKGTPYMDGVPFVTQCPILPLTTFRYEFNATEDGTYFWHSHIGTQRSDGLNGALIIHPSSWKDPHQRLYDIDDQVMIVNDWAHLDGNAGQIQQYHYRSGIPPDTILVNGMGRFQRFQRNGNTAFTPVAVFNVTRNRRYRFRMIDAGAEDCPIEMSIDDHTMLVISLDSNDIQPVEVDAITIWPGERVDFILNANQRPGNYWIRYRGYGLCQPSNTSEGVSQVAILHYDTVQLRDPQATIAWRLPSFTARSRVLNPYQSGTESSPLTDINVPLLTAMDENDVSLRKDADKQIYITFDMYSLDNYDFHREGLYGFNQVAANKRIGTLQLNHITLKLQPFPLLSQYDMIQPNMLCNEFTLPEYPYCNRNQCACTHVIPLTLNSVVELIFVDEGKNLVINHPLHLHGHFFRVISSVNLEGNVTVDRVRELDRRGQITRRLNRAPKKDTIKAPGGGYTIVRFHANNPGYWFFHCHFEQHSNVGMALVFKVGEHRDFPPKPRNFPTCGNFIPDPETDTKMRYTYNSQTDNFNSQNNFNPQNNNYNSQNRNYDNPRNNNFNPQNNNYNSQNSNYNNPRSNNFNPQNNNYNSQNSNYNPRNTNYNLFTNG